MTFGSAIKLGLGNLTNFKGRATRAEFWWYYLFITLLSIPVVIVIMIVGAAMLLPVLRSVDPDTGAIADDQVGAFWAAMGVFYGLILLAFAVELFLILAMWVRRLHDAGYSGHWLWLSLAGLSIVPLIFALLDTQNGTNQWGADPKAAERAAWAGVAMPYAAGPYAAVPYATAPPPIAQPPMAQPAAPPAPVTPPPPPPSGDPGDPFAAPPR